MMSTAPLAPLNWGRIRFRNPAAFYAGCTAIVAGVLLHLPTFISARSMHYKLVGMPMDGLMGLGMALIVVGLVLAAYGVTPAARPTGSARAHRAHQDLQAIGVVLLGDMAFHPCVE